MATNISSLNNVTTLTVRNSETLGGKSLAEVKAETKSEHKAAVNAYSAQQYYTPVALSTSGNITWNLDTAPFAKINMTGNVTLNTIENMKDGGVYVLLVKQPVAGGMTLSFNASVFQFEDGADLEISTEASAESLLVFSSDGTYMKGAIFGKNFS